MLDNKPALLSIVVPTKNRPETLSVLIDYVLSWASEDVELVIEDNSDCNTELYDFLETHRCDVRLRYFWSNAPLSAVENCDAAVARATGKFVVFIGDDDGVLRQSLDVARWMDSNGVDALYCNIGVYKWPGLDHAVRVNYKYNGLLLESKFTGKLTFVEPKKQLDRVLYSGGQSMYRIPRLYQGIVRKTALDEMRAKLGSCFPGPVPDMSNAVGLAPFVKRFAYTDVPLIVSGISKKSMSGKNSNRKHQGDIRQERSIPTNAYDLWTDRIPKYWCAPTIWGESALKAQQASHPDYSYGLFGFANLYAGCFAYSSKSFHKLIWEAMRHEKKYSRYLGCLFLVSLCFVLISLKRARILLSKYLFGLKGKSFQTIHGALAHLESRVEQTDCFWDTHDSHR